MKHIKLFEAYNNKSTKNDDWYAKHFFDKDSFGSKIISNNELDLDVLTNFLDKILKTSSKAQRWIKRLTSELGLPINDYIKSNVIEDVQFKSDVIDRIKYLFNLYKIENMK